MTLKNTGNLLLTLFVVLTQNFFAVGAVKSQRVKYNFNSDWKLFVVAASGAEKPGFNDGDWKNITMPRIWRTSFTARRLTIR